MAHGGLADAAGGYPMHRAFAVSRRRAANASVDLGSGASGERGEGCVKITISVTEAHLDNQVRGDCARCAVALAITETLRDGLQAEVWYGYGFPCFIEDLEGRCLLSPPFFISDLSKAFIRYVDSGTSKEQIQERFGLPFVLETDIPRKFLRQREGPSRISH